MKQPNHHQQLGRIAKPTAIAGVVLLAGGAIALAMVEPPLIGIALLAVGTIDFGIALVLFKYSQSR